MVEDVVIVDSVRTGLAKAFRGSFNMTRSDDMLAHCIDSLLDRNPNVDLNEVEDVVVGAAVHGGQVLPARAGQAHGDGRPRQLPDDGGYWHLGQKVSAPITGAVRGIEHPEVYKKAPPKPLTVEELDRTIDEWTACPTES